MSVLVLTSRWPAVTSARQVKVEPWPQAKQQRTPQARADLDAVVRSELPANGPFRLWIRVRDVQGVK
jgi:hypothetical protein